MAVTAETIDRLKSQLLTSGLSQKDQPLFQIINILIDAVRGGLQEVTILQEEVTSGGGSGTGDVVGPAGAVDDNLASYDGATGKLIQDSGIATPDVLTFAGGYPGGATNFLREDGTFAAPPGLAGAFILTDFTKDLGAGDRAGTFDITGLAGLTPDNNVLVVQTMQPITSKGDARDEFELQPIILTAYVVDAATIRALWNCDSVCVGNYNFAYMVSA